MKKRIKYIKKMFNYVLLNGILLLLLIGSSKTPEHYPNGTVIENLTWHLSLKDSLNILKMKNGVWQLPQIKDTNLCKKSYTYYKSPGEKYKQLFSKGLIGRIDQQESNSDDAKVIRFYRFSNKGTLLVGYLSPNTSKPLSIFDPPVIINPANPKESINNNSLLKTFINHKFDNGLKTMVIISPRGNGKYLNESGQKEKGVLYELTIIKDGTVQYGSHNLIVPGAVSISSNILADENGNLVLEWGIRKNQLKKKFDKKNKTSGSDYIEITKYKILK